jgi:hypothetical protein
MIYKIVNKNNGELISTKAAVAQTFFERSRGLMFRGSMDESEALMFYHTPSIHMFFMRFPIDVVFLDKNMLVIKVYKRLKPWRFACCFRSFLTLELPVDTVARKCIQVGDALELIPL